MLFSFFLGKIMNFGPMIIPRHKPHLFHLMRQLLINGTLKRTKNQLRWTLHNRLTLTIKWEATMMTLISSKLSSDSHNNHLFTIPNKNSTLTWSNKDETILTIIYIHISCYIENEIGWIFAIIYIVLLFFYWIQLLYLEFICLIFKPIVIWVVLLFYCLWL